MCNCTPKPTIARVLRSVKALTTAERAELRRILDEAPEAPSLADAIREHRAAANETSDQRQARLAAALTPEAVR